MPRTYVTDIFIYIYVEVCERLSYVHFALSTVWVREKAPATSCRVRQHARLRMFDVYICDMYKFHTRSGAHGIQSATIYPSSCLTTDSGAQNSFHQVYLRNAFDSGHVVYI